MNMLANNSHNGTLCYHDYDINNNSRSLQFEPETENSLCPDANFIKNDSTTVPQDFFDLSCKHTYDSSNGELHLLYYPEIAPLSPTETSVESLFIYSLDTLSSTDVSQAMTVLSSPDECLPFFMGSRSDIHDSELKLDSFNDSMTYCPTQMSSSPSPRSSSSFSSSPSSLSPPPVYNYFTYNTDSIMSSNTQYYPEGQNNEEKEKTDLPKTKNRMTGGASSINFISPFEEDYLQAINKISAKSKKIKCNTKSFFCVVCAHPFARKHDLQRHIRVHTGVKPYSCLHCKKAFIRTDALKHHLRVVETCRMSPIIQAMKSSGDRRYKNL